MKRSCPTAINIHQIYFFCKRERSEVSTEKYFCDIRIRQMDNDSGRFTVIREIRLGLTEERSLCKER